MSSTLPWVVLPANHPPGWSHGLFTYFRQLSQGALSTRWDAGRGARFAEHGLQGAFCGARSARAQSMPPACPVEVYVRCYSKASLPSFPPCFPSSSDGLAVAGGRKTRARGGAVCSDERDTPPGKPVASNSANCVPRPGTLRPRVASAPLVGDNGRSGKGDRSNLCAAPGTDRRLVRPFWQIGPVPFSWPYTPDSKTDFHEVTPCSRTC
jgi:hypothetical protein